MMTMREEIDQLAAAKGYAVEWNAAGHVQLYDPKRPTSRPPFMPDFIARAALLPPDHPDACQLRPGMASPS